MKYVQRLRPLAALMGLHTLDVSGKRLLEDHAWLAGRLPDMRCRWFAP